jgi:uncharacterized protein YfkK (UPF0435 family)
MFSSQLMWWGHKVLTTLFYFIKKKNLYSSSELPCYVGALVTDIFEVWW